jgi:acetyl-CoA carboxylase carboxyl transferase subunit alpha
VMIVGTQKGRGLKENLTHNFGMANPEGYRKALRLFHHAEKFHLPIVTFIDTPGAYAGIHGEQFGIGQAIALNIREMARLSVPIVSVVLGEGCSGGALGIGVANRIYMLEHAIYCVISPEGCASILWRDAKFASTAAEAMRLTAQDLLLQGIIDGIIPEPLGGAHHDAVAMTGSIRQTLVHALDELLLLSPQQRINQRYDKFRAIGAFEEMHQRQSMVSV